MHSWTSLNDFVVAYPHRPRRAMSADVGEASDTHFDPDPDGPNITALAFRSPELNQQLITDELSCGQLFH